MKQCLKLTRHSLPSAHNSIFGRTIFRTVRPMCARFFSLFSYINIEECIGKFLGAQFGNHVRPIGAHIKSLISNTDKVYIHSKNPLYVRQGKCTSGSIVLTLIWNYTILSHIGLHFIVIKVISHVHFKEAFPYRATPLGLHACACGVGCLELLL